MVVILVPSARPPASELAHWDEGRPDAPKRATTATTATPRTKDCPPSRAIGARLRPTGFKGDDVPRANGNHVIKITNHQDNAGGLCLNIVYEG